MVFLKGPLFACVSFLIEAGLMVAALSSGEMKHIPWSFLISLRLVLNNPKEGLLLSKQGSFSASGYMHNHIFQSSWYLDITCQYTCLSTDWVPTTYVQTWIRSTLVILGIFTPTMVLFKQQTNITSKKQLQLKRGLLLVLLQFRWSKWHKVSWKDKEGTSLSILTRLSGKDLNKDQKRVCGILKQARRCGMFSFSSCYVHSSFTAVLLNVHATRRQRPAGWFPCGKKRFVLLLISSNFGSRSLAKKIPKSLKQNNIFFPMEKYIGNLLAACTCFVAVVNMTPWFSGTELLEWSNGWAIDSALLVFFCCPRAPNT